LSLFVRVLISDTNEQISTEFGIIVYNELSHQFVVNLVRIDQIEGVPEMSVTHVGYLQPLLNVGCLFVFLALQPIVVVFSTAR
jgi:hypothetical protein